MDCYDCKYYEWYYNRCRKWDCEVDVREVHNCFEAYDTLIRNNMVNYDEFLWKAMKGKIENEDN